MKKLFLISFFLLSTSGSAQTLLFKKEGKVINSIDRKRAIQNRVRINYNKLPIQEKTLFNVWRKYQRTYIGYKFFDLLDRVYGEEWKKFKNIKFSAADGYQQTASISKMRIEVGNKTGILAHSEKGKNGFTIIKKKGKKIDPAPFYLVWSGFSKKDKVKHSDTIKWPYQLVEINITK